MIRRPGFLSLFLSVAFAFLPMLLAAPATALAQSPGSQTTWSMCYGNGSTPSHMECQYNGPGQCAITGTWALGTSSATCTYQSNEQASAVCTPSLGTHPETHVPWVVVSCTPANPETVCYVPGPPPAGDVSYPYGTTFCYPIAPPSVLVAQPELNAFGEQVVATQSNARTFTFGNSGTQWIETGAYSLQGQGFSVVGNTCYGILLYRGQSCSISVSFTPPAEGTFAGTLKLRHRSYGDSGWSWRTVAVAGTGVTQPQGPVVSFVPLVTTFSSAGYGVTAAPKTVAIKNIGTEPLNVLDVKVRGSDFTLSSNLCTAPLQPGGQCNAVVGFRPRAIGNRSGTIEVTSNAAGGPQSSPLTGVGAAPPNLDDGSASWGDGDEIGGSSPGLIVDSGPERQAGGEIESGLGEKAIIVNCSASWFDCFRDIDGNQPGQTHFVWIPPIMRKDPTVDLCKEAVGSLESPDTSMYALAEQPAAFASALRLADIGSNLLGSASHYVLDPINTASGNKFHEQLDYQGAGAFPLTTARTHNSQAFTATGMVRQDFGAGWVSSWDRSVTLVALRAQVSRGDGKSYEFILNSQTGEWTPPEGVLGKLIQQKNELGTTTGWTYTPKQGTTEQYDGSGRLLSVASNGSAYVLLYDAAGDRLSEVRNPYGRSIRFEYDSAGHVASLIDPAGGTTRYSYDSVGRLISVEYADGRIRQYRYEHGTYSFALTSIVDETGNTYATFTYDSSGRATGNVFAGGVGAGTVTYGSNYSITVNPDGTAWTRNFTRIGSKNRMTAVTPSCPDCGTGGETLSYSSNGLVASRTNRQGVRTEFSFNSRGLLTQQVEAVSAPETRTSNITWHPTLRRPVQVATGAGTVNFEYDSNGRMTRRAVSGTGGSGATTYSYAANGQLSEVIGPRTDVIDRTAFTYDSLGNVATVTNSMGQTTTYTYDAHGRATSATYADGTVDSVTYDPRGRILSQTIAGNVTSHTYNAVGKPASSTDPDGVTTTYMYDTAHRLIGMDRLGEKLRYTLDSTGRVTRTEILDAGNVLASASSVEFDGLGRVKKRIGAAGQTSTVTYNDAPGTTVNTVVTDALGNTTRTYMDSLGRRKQVFPPGTGSGNLTIQYDQGDRPLAITPPGISSTTFVYNALGLPSTVTGPDTGPITRTYDAEGNVVSRTDARNTVANYSYDAVGRVSQVTYSGGASATVGYDAGVGALGMVNAVTGPVASTSYSYDANGRLQSKTQMADGVSQAVTYDRGPSGRITEMTYPSGKVLAVTYVNGRVNSIAFDGKSIISNVEYFPFGPVESWIFGNGKEYTRYIDLDQRISRYLTPRGERRLTFDAASRIQRLDDVTPGLATRSQNFVYDAKGQVKSFAGFTSWAPSESQTFAYTQNGNRQSMTLNGVARTYVYQGGGNRLATISDGRQVISTHTYDAAGNTLTDGTRTFTYSADGRLSTVTAAGVVTSYVYDGDGQRVKKTTNGQVRRFVYGTTGNMLGEYDASGNPIQEFVWLGNIPIAVISGAQVGYVWSDHLNTPREITDDLNRSLWKWDSLPFGETAPDENPSGLGIFSFNHRFPGQYFDQETAIHQNWNREYNPSIGRYITADPIGLAGGTNLYAYAENNPVRKFDRKGLDACDSPEFWDTVFSQMDSSNDLIAGAIANTLAAFLLTQYGVQVSGPILEGAAYLKFVLEEYMTRAAFRSYSAYLGARAALPGLIANVALVVGTAEAGLFVGALLKAGANCMLTCHPTAGGPK